MLFNWPALSITSISATGMRLFLLKKYSLFLIENTDIGIKRQHYDYQI